MDRWVGKWKERRPPLEIPTAISSFDTCEERGRADME
jgi:hypothetical protein